MEPITSLEMSSSMVKNDEKYEIIWFSETEEGSFYSLSSSTSDNSNHGHNFDSEVDHVVHSRKVSSVVGSECRIDIGNGVDQVNIFSEILERDCRICQLSLDLESGIAIELGCSCKNDLAVVHLHCAETWFTIKGNKICEICNSIAQNIVDMNIIESRKQSSAVHTFTSEISVPIFEVDSMPLSPTSQNGECLGCKWCLVTLLLIICFVIFLLIFNKVRESGNRS